MRGDPPRADCVTDATGNNHGQTNLLNWTASQLQGSGGTYLKLAGAFTVTRLLPLGVELQYRIKSKAEAHERVAVQHELRVLGAAKSIVAADAENAPIEILRDPPHG